MDATTILLQRNQVVVPDHIDLSDSQFDIPPALRPQVGTLINNFLYYGFVPSREVLGVLRQLETAALTAWWNALESALQARKGDDKNIGDYIVYQNFPGEVLAMAPAEYWIRQIMIYYGVDPVHLQKPREPRAQMFEEVKLTVLHPAREGALEQAFAALLRRPAAWTQSDKAEVEWFLDQGHPVAGDIPFKENLVFVAQRCLKRNQFIPLATATDVLRLAAGLSDGDISLKEPTKFKLRRAERRYLLMLLEGTNDILEGVLRHRKVWKRLFHQLHVGEYRTEFPNAFRIADAVRRGEKFPTFNSQVEGMLEAKDAAVLPLLATRPGEFARRIVSLLPDYGEAVVTHFLPVLEQLETLKLLKLKRFLLTLNERRYRVWTPKGRWARVQIVPNDRRIDVGYRDRMVAAINEIVRRRIAAKWGDRFFAGEGIDRVKLPSNDATAVTRFHKGTRLPLPDNIQFIRTATYWQESGQTCWMDNGWNFFDAEWKSQGVCCWNVPAGMAKATAFSGDPVNSYNPKGRAGQLIDLYLDKLVQANVRYAVWNILSYNRIPFANLPEVMGLLMLGEHPETGKLIEPSRVNFAIPVTGSGLTKYLCYLDLVAREIVICDAGLPANVRSASLNATGLEQAMPAFVEYLAALPSVADILELFPASAAPDAIKVLYSDAGVAVRDERAYVFDPVNEDNSFTPLSLEDFLTA
ncbi:MAG: hypothetical protein AAGN35_12420 [Bacteroidota bacterium]